MTVGRLPLHRTAAALQERVPRCCKEIAADEGVRHTASPEAQE
jgi:hypothetical protein